MRRSYLFVILSFACFAPPLNAADVFRGETGVCVRSGEQINPAILVTDNPIVVWQDNRNGNWDIYAYDFARQQEYPVCIAAGDQTNPRMGWGPANLIIVWQDNRNGNWDIYALTVPAFYDHTMDWLNAVELPVCGETAVSAILMWAIPFSGRMTATAIGIFIRMTLKTRIQTVCLL